eukprot:4517550-Pleurochrysis_carterae.AAC.1
MDDERGIREREQIWGDNGGGGSSDREQNRGEHGEKDGGEGASRPEAKRQGCDEGGDGVGG